MLVTNGLQNVKELVPEVYTLCDNAAFAKFVAAIGTTNSAAATMIFTKLTVSHERVTF